MGLSSEFSDKIIIGLEQHLFNFIYIFLVVVLSIFSFSLINYFYKKFEKTGTQLPLKKIYVQLALGTFTLLLVLIGIPGVSKNVLQLFGLSVGAIVAFSSSTLIANFMSGILIKIIEPYKVGHMIKIKDTFGKVYHIGLLHTEIQTSKREIVSIPNLVAMSDKSINYTENNYIIHTSIGIGYDVPRLKVERLLLRAIEKSGLQNPFVLIAELGNYAVTYEANGLIADVSKIVSTRSNLRKNIIDEFAKSRIEILSPMYINKKEIHPEKKILPKKEHVMKKFKEKSKNSIPRPEKVMYEKADEIIQEKESKEVEEKIKNGMTKILEEDTSLK